MPGLILLTQKNYSPLKARHLAEEGFRVVYIETAEQAQRAVRRYMREPVICPVCGTEMLFRNGFHQPERYICPGKKAGDWKACGVELLAEEV